MKLNLLLRSSGVFLISASEVVILVTDLLAKCSCRFVSRYITAKLAIVFINVDEISVVWGVLEVNIIVMLAILAIVV